MRRGKQALPTSLAHHRRPMPRERLFTFLTSVSPSTQWKSGRPFRLVTSKFRSLPEYFLRTRDSTVSPFTGPERSLAHNRRPMNNYCIIRGLIKIPSLSVTVRRSGDITGLNVSSTKEFVILGFSPLPRETAVTSCCAAETYTSALLPF